MNKKKKREIIRDFLIIKKKTMKLKCQITK